METKMDERGIEILGKSAHLFMHYGIKSMTMDDIARHLGVSKKTLYLYVNDKNDLVEKVMDSIVSNEITFTTKLCEIHDNAIDMLFELSRDVSQKFGQMHPSINYDLQKYHPSAWQKFADFKNVFVSKCVEDNIVKGIEQGLYRSNLDPYIVSKLYASKMDLCTDGEIFPPDRYDFKTVHFEFMRYHIRGIASEKGLKYLLEKVKKEKIDL